MGSVYLLGKNSSALRNQLFSRYSTSSGTGRPVAPFSLPCNQAVPAISRCAQGYFLANRDRKQAAVMLPALGPPILAISAKLLSSWDWYSSQIGKRHTGSLTSRPVW